MATGNHSDESIINLYGVDKISSGLRNFAGLTGVLLLVGILANAYLLRLTDRSRFPVQWETARLSLRYTSVLDLSLCFVLVPVILWPWVNCQTGSYVHLTFRCAYCDAERLLFLGFILVGSGVDVVFRQVYMLNMFQLCTLNMFQNETSLISEQGGRTVKLLRDVAVFGAVYIVGYLFLSKFVPDIHILCCSAEGWLTSELFLLPLAVNVILVVVVCARSSPPEVDVERYHVTRTTSGDLSEKAIVSHPPHNVTSGLDKITHSRWKRFIIVAIAAVLTWIMFLATMVLWGVFLHPSVGTVVVIGTVSALHSAWTAFYIFRYWT